MYGEEKRIGEEDLKWRLIWSDENADLNDGSGIIDVPPTDNFETLFQPLFPLSVNYCWDSNWAFLQQFSLLQKELPPPSSIKINLPPPFKLCAPGQPNNLVGGGSGVSAVVTAALPLVPLPPGIIPPPLAPPNSSHVTILTAPSPLIQQPLQQQQHATTTLVSATGVPIQVTNAGIVAPPANVTAAAAAPAVASRTQFVVAKKKHQCQSCEKSYSTSTGLKQHVDSAHLGKRPFECDICGKAFARNTLLKIHKDSVHHGIRHPCQECGRQFSGRNRLLEHIRKTHSWGLF